MNQQSKKSVLIDLSNSESSNNKNSKPPILWIFIVLVMVVSGLVFAIVSRSKEDPTARYENSDTLELSSIANPSATAEATRIEAIEPTTTEKVVETPTPPSTPEPDADNQPLSTVPQLDLSKELKTVQASTVAKTEAPTKTPVIDKSKAPTTTIIEKKEARENLIEVQRIYRDFQKIPTLRFSDDRSNALAFQLESARQSNAGDATIHALENEYSKALAEQTINVLRSYLTVQADEFEAKDLGNYATLESKQFALKLKEAEQIEVQDNAFEALIAYKSAYAASQQFLKGATFNIKSLAKRAENSQQIELASKLYSELLDINASDADAIAFLNKHAYPAGGHIHMAPHGIQMHFIPAGEYALGTPELEFQRDTDETLHAVKLTKAYYIAVTEVTQKQWIEVMGVLPAQFPNDQETTGEQLPVHSVSWAEAVEFCKALSALSETITYRLPTEAEWEIACRASLETPFNNGTDQLSLQEANIFDPNSNQNLDKPVNVSSYPPNNWGLYDMHGNVWEWTSDWMADYSKRNNTDPSNHDLKGNSDENLRTKVLRGGSFYDEASFARSGNRWNYAPSIATGYIGFRIVCTAIF